MPFFVFCFLSLLHFSEIPELFTSERLVAKSEQLPVKLDTLRLFDTARKREVPVAIYNAGKLRSKAKVAIISHGYHRNQGMHYMDYGFIANALAERGYLVASIQHELPGDALIPTSGPLYETRLPFWERGVSNILFVIDQLKTKYPTADFNNLLLLGHSNGGDMSMLFASKYPEKLAKVISLDNRRVAIPRVRKPVILTLRSSDQPADAGVIPTVEEQKQLGIRVVRLPATIHNDMYDGGTAEQRAEMLNYILDFLHLKS